MAKKTATPKQPSSALLQHLNRISDAHQDALTPAQELTFEALEAPTKAARLKLIEEALRRSPLCADGWGILAQEAPEGSALALLLWRQAVAAGVLGLGPLMLQLEPDEYWADIETRPYLRARWGLATELWRHGQHAAAIAEAREVLALNPDDNLGLRYALVEWLLAERQEEAAAALLQTYEEDSAATWAYARALLGFRQGGASPAAEAMLKDALAANPHVAAVLLGKPPAKMGDAYAEGSPEEAAWAAPAALPGWRATPGALEWLAQHSAPAAPAKRPRKAKVS
jgi:tetratricopeptide (TPR) repeat protein